MTDYYAQCPDFDGRQHEPCPLTRPVETEAEYLRRLAANEPLEVTHPQHCHFDITRPEVGYPTWVLAVLRNIGRTQLNPDHLTHRLGWHQSSADLAQALHDNMRCSVHRIHPNIWRRADAFHRRHDPVIRETWEQAQLPPDPNNPGRWRPYYWRPINRAATLQSVW